MDPWEGVLVLMQSNFESEVEGKRDSQRRMITCDPTQCVYRDLMIQLAIRNLVLTRALGDNVPLVDQ